MEDYEWDDVKSSSNREKHGIDFTAIERFAWRTAKTDETYSHGELRYIATGYLGNRLHVVVYTLRGEKTRIISMRKASESEERRYGETH